MNRKQFYIGFFLIFCCLSLSAKRALYVDGFASILGDIVEEDALLQYAQTNNIETLLLYELHLVHANINMSNPTTNYVLADFIRKAKTSYGIENIGASGENESFFIAVIHAYNNTRTDPLEKFDIYNLEFEYWNSPLVENGGYYCTTYLTPNGLPCTVDGAFQYFVSILQTMDSLVIDNTHPITTEAYVGWPTAGQADTIATKMDRVRVHAYVANPNAGLNYSENRLIDFANANPGMNISILFSSEPDFMQSWLENYSMIEAENIFRQDWSTESVGWPNNINVEGFTYFRYSHMANISLGAHIIFSQDNLEINKLDSEEILILKGQLEQYSIMLFDANANLIEELNTQGLSYIELNVKQPYVVHTLQCTNNSNGKIELTLLINHL